ncbi:MAG: NFACT family protein [Oscillospiraceae bacterium]|jgi:predicted ribosome quality control (RQC) complex YloA/Tae2 family protein|nr:NFACT family protein [Oscillospiraceae bacterium]
MALDAVCLEAVVGELSGSVTGMKIDKVQQPERDMLLLTGRGRGGQSRVLISAGQSDARCHATGARFENPDSPPMFCMLLRKHLAGSTIMALEQPPRERVVDIVTRSPDMAGDLREKRLILELIGNNANVILADGDGIIVDCMRRVGGALTGKRAVQPGLIYRRPPLLSKLDPCQTGAGELLEMLSRAPGGAETGKWLLDTFSGLSPLICREMQYMAYGDTQTRVASIIGGDGGRRLAEAFESVAAIIGERRFEPYMLLDESGEPFDFSYMRIRQYGGKLEVRRADSFSGLLDEFYAERSARERLRRRASDVTKTVKSAIGRAERKIGRRREELERTAGREGYRKRGDIIMANIHGIKRGDTLLRALDLYAEDGSDCAIELDPLKTPQQNAAAYYKEYTKLKNARIHLDGQIRLGEQELEYLLSVKEEISMADGERGLEEIRGELADAGYLRGRRPPKRNGRAASKPLVFTAPSGAEILVGRNNAQNDELTHRVAARSDIWLHARGVPGSHVIIRANGAPPDSATVQFAASLAARYSQARGSLRAAVDYCQARAVKRRPGGRPGMVTYTDFETVTVDIGAACGNEAHDV